MRDSRQGKGYQNRQRQYRRIWLARRSLPAGLAICVAGGVFSAMFNFGYAFGSPLPRRPRRSEARLANAVNAIWLVELAAGGLINIGYCWYLLRGIAHGRCSEGQRPRMERRLDHGAAVDRLGRASMAGARRIWVHLGPTLGWSLWNAILIVTTMVCGVLTDEWDGARGRPLTCC